MIVYVATLPEIDFVVSAIVGVAGLEATYAAVCAGKTIGLANKECLVAAGELIIAAAKEHNVALLPIDSEHNAVHQAMRGGAPNEVKQVWLTASGGPFRNTPLADFEHITPAQALKHPTWVMGQRITIDSATMIGSTTTRYTWSTVSQSAYYDSSKTLPVSMGTLATKERYYLVVTLKNTGNITWTSNGSNPVNLGTSDSRDRASPFCDPTWINSSPGCNRIASLKEYTVAPGQIGSFEFWVTAPSTGSYTESYLPVVEGKAWLQSPSAVFSLGVTPYTWTAGKQSIYTDDSKTTMVDSNNLKLNTRYYIAAEIKNTGTIVWNKLGQNPTSLGTSSSRDRISTICDTSWLGCNRSAIIHEYTVAPGQTGSFEFWIKTPPTAGSLTESFTPLVEGQNWMGLNGITLNLKIQ